LILPRSFCFVFSLLTVAQLLISQHN
jgi:hypothetical protein